MIQFEIDHVKAILTYLDELPHKFAANVIKYIKDIAEPQVKALQSIEAGAITKVESAVADVKSDVAEIQQEVKDVVSTQQ